MQETLAVQEEPRIDPFNADRTREETLTTPLSSNSWFKPDQRPSRPMALAALGAKFAHTIG
ncbi:hypothetical protein HC928_02435 [bacterium]|nr:hypothetical protein [bacterium]